jgi:hypothetical protein
MSKEFPFSTTVYFMDRTNPNNALFAMVEPKFTENYLDDDMFPDIVVLGHATTDPGMLEELFKLFNYEGNISEFSHRYKLEPSTFDKINETLVNGTLPHSMSTGDIVVVQLGDMMNNEKMAYQCRSMGWERIPIRDAWAEITDDKKEG